MIGNNNNYYKGFLRKDKAEEFLKKKGYVKGKLMNESKKWFIIDNNNEKIFIEGIKSRNRALEEDIVLVKIDAKNKQFGIV